MRIAFTSCMCTRVFAEQPVWDQIAAQQPDHLVLLGDSIYLDIGTSVHPIDMGEFEFAGHLVTLYQELLAQAQFRKLVRGLPPGSTHAIWDDHDFLWNDAQGAEVAAQPAHTGKIRLSTAAFEAFRIALSQGLPDGSFPIDASDARLWDANQPPLTTPSLPLAADVWLHLLDGRSVRTRTQLLAESKRTMFGAPQRDRFAAAIAAAPPEAVHLVASGSTIAGWQRYELDRKWIDGLAARRRVLMLTGDIHRNALDAFFTSGLPLHEATSSGAAVKDAVVVGSARQNYGLLEVEPDTVTIRLFEKGRERARRRLLRATWLPG